MPALAPFGTPEARRRFVAIAVSPIRTLVNAAQPGLQLLLQSCRRGAVAARQGTNHHPLCGIQLVQHAAGDVPQPPRNLMPLDRCPHGFRDDQADQRTVSGPRIVSASGMNHDVGLRGPSSVPDCRTEIGRPPHSVPRGKHRRATRAQAVNACRPLRRRPETIARPARVRIRNRKPCTRARRRLFGWKVRLPLATAHSPLASGIASAGHTGGRRCLAQAMRSVSLASFCVSLVTGAVSDTVPVAAVSPTFGRLFEGTDAGSRGQTRSATLPRQQRVLHSRHTRHHSFDQPKIALSSSSEGVVTRFETC